MTWKGCEENCAFIFISNIINLPSQNIGFRLVELLLWILFWFYFPFKYKLDYFPNALKAY